jgi:glycosyltransferase involved in cell wall biosynthesis
VKILFVNLSPLVFDVATPEREPLGGTESCLCYLARQLAQNGHDITIAARLPEGALDTLLGVRQRPVAVIQDQSFFAAETFDVIICLNAALACPTLREMSPSSVLLLWDHIPPEQPAMAEMRRPEVQAALDHIVYVSDWQRTVTEEMFSLKKRCTIIGNGLTPAFENLFASPQELLKAKQLRAAYTSIPYRGLPVLLSAMEQMQTGLELDLFSSMRVYQEADTEHAAIFTRAAKNYRIKNHGAVSQKDLAAALKPVTFLTYPCIVAETFCLSVLEALAAGLKVISTDVGAIKSTSMNYADLLPVTEGEDGTRLAREFKSRVDKNVQNFKDTREAWGEKMFEQVQAVNALSLWTHRAKEWEKLLRTLMAYKSNG